MNRIASSFSWILGALLGAALFIHAPTADSFTRYGLQAITYALCTAISLYYGILVQDSEFSPTHAIGIVAFLSLPLVAYPLNIWAIFVGAVIAGLVLVGHETGQTRRPLTFRAATRVLTMSARATLSFVAAAEVYFRLGGEVPLKTPLHLILPLMFIYSLVYSGVYVAVFALELLINGRWLRQVNIQVLAAIIAVPIPFAMLTAVLLTITPYSVIIFAAGVALATLGLNRFSYGQHRLRKQLDEQRSLAAVSQALQSDLKLNSLLQAIYKQTLQLLHSDQFVVALYPRKSQELEFPLVIRQGKPVNQYADSGGKTLLGQVLQSQRPLLIKEDVIPTAQRLGVQPPVYETLSWLGVPLVARGRLLGAITVGSEDAAHHFSEDDQRLLTIVAASASVAIDNAQLYEEQTERANQLATLNRILAQLTGTLSPSEVLNRVVESAREAAGASAAAVYLFWDEARSTLALGQSIGFSERFAVDPMTPLITDQTPILVHDLDVDRRAAPYREALKREGQEAWAEMPLLVGEAQLGALLFFYDTPQEFDNDDVEILRAFTNQAAQAIQNARQYSTTDQALVRRIEQVHGLAALGGQLSTAVTVNEICQLALTRALEMLMSSAGLVALCGEQGATLSVIAQTGYPDSLSLTPHRLQQSLVGEALNEGRALRISDASVEALLTTTRAQLAVPIMRSGVAFGAILLESEQSGTFHEEDTYFLSQIANQVMVAIDNKRLFERITEARDRLQVILDTMKEGIVLIDQRGEVALANPRVDLIGITPDQLLNHNIEVLLERPDFDLAEHMGFESDQKVRKLLKSLRAPETWADVEPASYGVPVRGQMRHIERHVIPIYGADHKPIGILLVFYDETEAEELSQMRENWSQMLVHDLRSPLTAVTTGLKLLRDMVPQDNTLRPMIATTTDTSQRAIRKMMVRLDSLLDISRLDSGVLTLEVQPTDFVTLADSVCADLGPLAQDLDVTLVTEIAAHPPAVEIDRDKVERVLQNLVDNALKFCPAGGHVIIRTHSLQVSNRLLRIDVVDNGPGIPDEDKPKLFDRFFQIKGRRGARRGSGLGLTFCRLVVEAHGGKIWVEDNPGGGSIFAFTLPVASP
jgi:PAS domain S-box-containing protein